MEHSLLVEETDGKPASSGAVDSTVWGDRGLSNHICTLWEYTHIAVKWLHDHQTTTRGKPTVTVPNMGKAQPGGWITTGGH